MFKEYFDYLKNNPEKYWFKKKLFGWGWVPVKWQGWLVIAIFIGFVAWFASNLGSVPTNADLIWYFIKIFIAILVLLAVCYKTGEKPCWQWGLTKKNKK